MKPIPANQDRNAWIELLKSLGDSRLKHMHKSLSQDPTQGFINGFTVGDWVDMIVTARYELAGFE